MQTLTVAMFNLCYVFCIVFIKGVKLCFVPLIIVKMGLTVDGVCNHLHPPKKKLAAKHEQSAMEAKLPQQAGTILMNVCLLFHRLWHDQLDMT